eukprot:Sspe_Gene.16391::Locus_5776_Transcript_1_1_Confidence_1.000_Length_2227::g.16391::m.16391
MTFVHRPADTLLLSKRRGASLVCEEEEGWREGIVKDEFVAWLALKQEACFDKLLLLLNVEEKLGRGRVEAEESQARSGVVPPSFHGSTTPEASRALRWREMRYHRDAATFDVQTRGTPSTNPTPPPRPPPYHPDRVETPYSEADEIDQMLLQREEALRRTCLAEDQSATAAAVMVASRLCETEETHHRQHHWLRCIAVRLDLLANSQVGAFHAIASEEERARRLLVSEECYDYLQSRKSELRRADYETLREERQLLQQRELAEANFQKHLQEVIMYERAEADDRALLLHEERQGWRSLEAQAFLSWKTAMALDVARQVDSELQHTTLTWGDGLLDELEVAERHARTCIAEAEEAVRKELGYKEAASYFSAYTLPSRGADEEDGGDVRDAAMEA